jgi:cytoskeletal protein CcmA (bactofilin family)
MSKGRVHGNVTNLAGCLIIHDGGIVEGQCSIANKEKMKSLLPQEFPKLLPEQSSAPPKVINTLENTKESSSISGETSA